MADEDVTLPEGDDRLIGITEAAEILGVNRATLANWLQKGRIPALQYGPRGIYRVRYGDVIEFMEASRIRPSDEDQEGN
jgi:excisionase family DNA binding protein